MPDEKTKNDVAWEKLFDSRKILADVKDKKFHIISAADINKEREARLMTKFDYSVSRPKIFRDNALAILPNSRSSYIIGHFDCYSRLPSKKAVEIADQGFPDWIQTISSKGIYSESAALMCAQHAGLISDVLGQEAIFTVFGRMSTGEFNFSIRASDDVSDSKQIIAVDRAQCEIDGGFESADCFAIVEAKNEDATDFHIRQLYYPYRLWTNKLDKQVVPILLTYSNEVFSFFKYEFDDKEDYNSLRLVEHKRYQITSTQIQLGDIRSILKRVKVVKEPSVTFPQADKFTRVIDLLGKLWEGNGLLTEDDVTSSYVFNSRQTFYYTDAAKYLGLVESHRDQLKGNVYYLTSLGKQIMDRSPRARNLALIELILSFKVFNFAAHYYIDNSQAPSLDLVAKAIQGVTTNLGPVTCHRRAGTVISWLRWMMDLTADS